MKIESKNICPIYREPCKQLDCAWFIQLRGTNPNTGAEVDDWGCAVAWMPVLMIETAKETRQAGAAIESFRNEMVKANSTTAALLLAQPRLQPLVGPK